jgi:hypothetical protein
MSRAPLPAYNSPLIAALITAAASAAFTPPAASAGLLSTATLSTLV